MKKKNLITFQAIIDLGVIVSFLTIVATVFIAPIYMFSPSFFGDDVMKYLPSLFFILLSISFFLSQFTKGVIMTKKLIILDFVLLVVGIILFFNPIID